MWLRAHLGGLCHPPLTLQGLTTHKRLQIWVREAPREAAGSFFFINFWSLGRRSFPRSTLHHHLRITASGADLARRWTLRVEKLCRFHIRKWASSSFSMPSSSDAWLQASSARRPLWLLRAAWFSTCSHEEAPLSGLVIVCFPTSVGSHGHMCACVCVCHCVRVCVLSLLGDSRCTHFAVTADQKPSGQRLVTGSGVSCLLEEKKSQSGKKFLQASWDDVTFTFLPLYLVWFELWKHKVKHSFSISH